MISGLVVKLAIILSVGAASTNWDRGFAAHYSPGLMARVANNRNLPIVPCMISSPVYEIGTWVYVEGINTGKRLYCRVTDVSNPASVDGKESDRDRHIRMALLAELAFENTLDICGSTTLANRECPILIGR